MVDPQPTTGSMADELRQHGVDVAIPFSAREYPDCQVRKLFAVSIVTLCSPDLLRDKYPLRRPADLRYHTLIHVDSTFGGRPDWSDWLKAAGVEGVDPSHGSHFSHTPLALAAAIDGQGVALSLEPLAADDLAAGRLVIPFTLRLPLQQSYYVVCPKPVPNDPKIAVFRQWLLREAKQKVYAARADQVQATQRQGADAPVAV